jgi:hypothetical protein
MDSHEFPVDVARGGGRTDTCAVSVGSAQTTVDQEESDGTARSEGSVGHDGCPSRNAEVLAPFGHRAGQLHLGAPCRLPPRRGTAVDLRTGERN